MCRGTYGCFTCFACVTKVDEIVSIYLKMLLDGEIKTIISGVRCD